MPQRYAADGETIDIEKTTLNILKDKMNFDIESRIESITANNFNNSHLKLFNSLLNISFLCLFLNLNIKNISFTVSIFIIQSSFAVFTGEIANHPVYLHHHQ
jgi:hypothetical protein